MVVSLRSGSRARAGAGGHRASTRRRGHHLGPVHPSNGTPTAPGISHRGRGRGRGRPSGRGRGRGRGRGTLVLLSHDPSHALPSRDSGMHSGGSASTQSPIVQRSRPDSPPLRHEDRGHQRLSPRSSGSYTHTDLGFENSVDEGDELAEYCSEDEDDCDAEEQEQQQPQNTSHQHGRSGRGPAKGRTIILTMHGDDLFHPRTGRSMDTRLPRQMTIAIRGRLSGGVWPTWSSVPEDVREIMCKDWMDRIDFRESDINRARNAFFITAPQRMRSLMYYARRKATLIADTSNISDCIDGRGRPSWLPVEIWEQLIREHWGSSSFATASDRGKKSRNTQLNGVVSRHTGGSVPFEARELEMSLRENRKVRFEEVFKATHQFADGTYTDGRAESSISSYMSAMTAKYGEDHMTWPHIDASIYFQSFGQSRRGRYYGLGSGGIGACTVSARRSSAGRTTYSTLTSGPTPSTIPAAASDHEDLRAPSTIPASASDHEDLRAQMVDLRAQMSELANQERAREIHEAAVTTIAPSQEDIEQRVHQLFEARFAALQERLQSQVAERMDNEIKRAKEERKKAEEERTRWNEMRWSQHVNQLNTSFINMANIFTELKDMIVARDDVSSSFQRPINPLALHPPASDSITDPPASDPPATHPSASYPATDLPPLDR